MQFAPVQEFPLHRVTGFETIANNLFEDLPEGIRFLVRIPSDIPRRFLL